MCQIKPNPHIYVKVGYSCGTVTFLKILSCRSLLQTVGFWLTDLFIFFFTPLMSSMQLMDCIWIFFERVKEPSGHTVMKF